jgi:hypothetical protein
VFVTVDPYGSQRILDMSGGFSLSAFSVSKDLLDSSETAHPRYHVLQLALGAAKLPRQSKPPALGT